MPTGPTVLENHDKAAPAPTFEDMIRTSFDEVLFEYYFTKQLALVDVVAGTRTPIGADSTAQLRHVRLRNRACIFGGIRHRSVVFSSSLSGKMPGR